MLYSTLYSKWKSSSDILATYLVGEIFHCLRVYLNLITYNEGSMRSTKPAAVTHHLILSAGATWALIDRSSQTDWEVLRLTNPFTEGRLQKLIASWRFARTLPLDDIIAVRRPRTLYYNTKSLLETPSMIEMRGTTMVSSRFSRL